MSDTARFRRIEAADGVLYIAASFEAPARSGGLLEPGGLERLLAGAPTIAGGRAATWVVELPHLSERLHLRPLHHGGALAFLTQRSFLGLGRPLAELEVTAELLERGAPVPRPALVLGRRTGPFWHATLGTVHEEDTRDAAAFLASRPSPARMLRAARAAGSAVRRFHDAGGRHADLQAANLLVRERGECTGVVVIDLDRARLVERMSPARRMKELMRLYRSLRKRDLLEIVGPRGCAAFLGAYTGGERALRHALLDSLPRERLWVAIHALGYR